MCPNIGSGQSLSFKGSFLEEDFQWYKDAIIYEVHVRAFYDSDNDGVGDFLGLVQKLDYIQDLGVNAIWLLPFYESPMRDDGYDISNYRGIHSVYGTRDDFQYFIREAHRRGLRVITELVINHTSDSHPWFQSARRAPQNSRKRDFYVWSDDPNKFPEARVIFTDTESSNWSWDRIASAYYWHRFFSHQPDLNHNNPRVVKAIMRVMRYWLDMGVDGLRLDAIPYLCVREGTNNENLSETHAVIREMRALINERYRNCMLLAEANQWPEDVCEYFGNGDECHMAYHFPLMPRIFIALAQEDRHPIVEILNQTPRIPEGCQWAIFLRNHDELTLEMVTKKERDYLYQMYAEDPQMRLNVGIRRRLAPLMDNDRRKIEMVVWLLMTLPGSPIIYYGDEIGMGDNIYLGDRNGVRTPMQWSSDRNAGFSRADPQKLYLPLVMDPVYGYETVNVEAQGRNASSLINWTKRCIALRKAHKAFGRGIMEMMRPGNRKIFAYLRSYRDEIIVCVANLSRTPQAVELDLSSYKGYVPVELLGRSSFPPITGHPYQVTLTGYGFFVFRLDEKAPLPLWHEEKRLIPTEIPLLVLKEGWRTFLTKHTISQTRNIVTTAINDSLYNDVLMPYITGKHWFAGHGKTLQSIVIAVRAEWRTLRGSWLMTIVEIRFLESEVHRYFFPLAIAWEDEMSDVHIQTNFSSWVLAKVRQRDRVGMLYGAFGDDVFCFEVVRAMGANLNVPFVDGQLEYRSTDVYASLINEKLGPIERPALEQTNTNIFYGKKLIFKGYRRLQEGVNSESEMWNFLSKGEFMPNVAPIAGTLEWRRKDGSVIAIGLLQKYVTNQGDGWTVTIDYLERIYSYCLIERPDVSDHLSQIDKSFFLFLIEKLGKRTAQLHCALNRFSDNPAFDPEPFFVNEIKKWVKNTIKRVNDVCASVEAVYSDLSDQDKIAVSELLVRRFSLIEYLHSLRVPSVRLVLIRHHGNYNLSQVLIHENDFYITDFGGEPGRTTSEHRKKHTPLYDVAGILYSLHCAGVVAMRRFAADRPEDCVILDDYRVEWERQAVFSFLSGYDVVASGSNFYTTDSRDKDVILILAIVNIVINEVMRKINEPGRGLDIPLRVLLNLSVGKKIGDG